MTGLVKRLEAMTPPLVRRETGREDGRSVDVLLTPEGDTRFLAVQADFINQARTLLGLLSDQERQNLIHTLERYVTAIATYFPVSSTGG
jgi:DNA-binding MarR family transcriptional regulator